MATGFQQKTKPFLKGKRRHKIVRNSLKRRQKPCISSQSFVGNNWTYDPIHPYDIDSGDPWCNMPIALLVTGVIVFAAVLIAAVAVNHNNHFWTSGEDDHDYYYRMGRDSDETMSEYARMISSLQKDVDTQEWTLQCPIGSHAWHPKGSSDPPACRVNFPWPVAVDTEIIHPEEFDASLRNDHDPCVSFEAYVCHGWHLSDPTKGAVGDARNLPPSRGFSELRHRNAQLKMKTAASDMSFVDTRWGAHSASFERVLLESHSRQSYLGNIKKDLDGPTDNRIYFHKMVASCAKSLSGAQDDLSEFERRVRGLLTVKKSDTASIVTPSGLLKDARQASLGFMFGRAQCHGAAPVLYATPALDIKNKEQEVVNVEPVGVLGVRSVLLDSGANRYRKKHVAMISLACRVLVHLRLHTNANVCTSDALAVEDMLVWNSLDDSIQSGETLFKPLSVSAAGNASANVKPTIDDENLPIVNLTRQGLFTTDWWKAYEHGLVGGGCVGRESLEALQAAPVWTYRLEYTENLESILARGDSACTVKQWKNFLRVALTLDYLEHTNIARIETEGETPLGKPADRTTHGATRSITRPWEVRDVHKRGHHLHVTDRHFGPSSSLETRSFRASFASYVRSFLNKKTRGTASNADKTDWDLSHYVTVDPEAASESHLAYFYQCSAIGTAYLPGVADDTFAAVLTSKEERDSIYDVTTNVLNAIVESIQTSDLLTDTAKGNLTAKAQAIAVRVAVPWHGHEQPGYQGTGIEGESFYMDAVRVRSWHTRTDFDRVFSPDAMTFRRSTDPSQRTGQSIQYHFGMSTSAVNAYYSPEENSINILAGILGAPFYDAKYSKASLYATIGSVIGHELSHGFDSTGVKFDPKGSYRHWMSQEDERAYEEREQCFVDRYSRKTRLGNKNNGKSTLTENIADTIGLRASLRAFLNQGHPVDMKLAMQEFVEAYGQVWCANQTPESEKGQIQRDPHSPANVRIDGAITSLRTPDGRSPLAIAYGCPAESPMTREPPCVLW